MIKILGHIVRIWRENRLPVLLIVAAGIILIFFTFYRHRLTTNPRSRIITVERLVTAGTWAHATPSDSSRFEPSIDAVMVGEKRYSSKPPNYPLVMAGQAKVLQWVTGWDFFDHQVTYVRLLVLLNQVIPYILMLWMALLFARRFTRDPWTLAYLMLALSVGSLPFGYAVTINNHSLSAILFFLSFFLTYLIVYEKLRKPAAGLALGLLLGYGASIELPGLIFAGIFGLFLLRKAPKMAILAALAGIVPFAVQSMVMFRLTGDIRPFYLQGEYYYFEGSYWLNPESHDLSREPKWLYAFHSIFGHHGLLSLSPVLLLGFAGGARILKRRTEPYWPMWAGVLAGVLLAVVYFIFRTYNYGGWCIGMRWFLHFMPMLMFMGIPAIEWLGKRSWGRALALLILLISAIPNVQAFLEEAFVRSWLELWWIN